MAAATCYEMKHSMNDVLMTGVGRQYHYHHVAKPVPPPSGQFLLQDYEFNQPHQGRTAAVGAAASPTSTRIKAPTCEIQHGTQKLLLQQKVTSPCFGGLLDVNYLKPPATPQILQEYCYSAATSTITSTTASSPRSSKASPVALPPARSILPGSASAPLKDFSQPLHVDCSVEYELPSQVKPPPGSSEPLLMIHPLYYRRAELERRTMFVNNMPPRASSATSSSSGSRHHRISRSTKSASAILASSGQQPPPQPVTTGLMVNPMMPAPAVAAASQLTAIVPVKQRLNGMLPPSPTLAAIVQDVQPTAAAVAAAAATYQAALTAATAVHHAEAKQPHPKMPTPASELDKNGNILGLYNPGIYFAQSTPARAHPQYQVSALQSSPVVGATILHQAYPSQAPSHQSYMMAAPRSHHQVVGSSAGPTTVVVSHHHPYRRTTSSSRSSAKSSTSAVVPSSVPTTGGSAAAAAASYMAAAAAAAAATNAYARQPQAPGGHHHHHHHQQMIYHQPHQQTPPVYHHHHALLQQS